MKVPFSLPLIDELVISEMMDTLTNTGWVTTGPKVFQLEQEISNLTRMVEEKDGTIEKYEEEIYQLNKQLLLEQDKSPEKKAVKAPVKKAAAKSKTVKSATKPASTKTKATGKKQ